MFSGSIVALVTPMLENGDIDFTAMESLITWHIVSGTQAIVVLGTTGESSLIKHQEHALILRKAVEIAAGRISIIAGTGLNSTQLTIEATRNAMHAGVDACLIMTPAYIKPTQAGLYQHYQSIAQAVGIPIILYNVPSRTACDLLPETVIELAKISNIIGIKEATGKIERVAQIREACHAGFSIYSGDDVTGLSLILNGGKGIISVTANVAPEAMAQLCQAALQDDQHLAHSLNEKLMPLHQSLFVETNPIPSKWALYKMNKIKAGIRLPLTFLATENQQTVLLALQAAGIL